MVHQFWVLGTPSPLATGQLYCLVGSYRPGERKGGQGEEEGEKRRRRGGREREERSKVRDGFRRRKERSGRKMMGGEGRKEKIEDCGNRQERREV